MSYSQVTDSNQASLLPGSLIGPTSPSNLHYRHRLHNRLPSASPSNGTTKATGCPHRDLPVTPGNSSHFHNQLLSPSAVNLAFSVFLQSSNFLHAQCHHHLPDILQYLPRSWVPVFTLIQFSPPAIRIFKDQNIIFLFLCLKP